MRATEFTNRQQSILEGKNQVQIGDLVLHIYEDGQDVDVRVMDGDRQVGYVIFLRDGKLLIPDDLSVDEEYRGRGIAKKMYDYVKSLGFKIIRSGVQTNMGKRFWDKNRGEHVDVWEEEVRKNSEKVNIQAHRQGTTVWLDYFEVTPKRQGLGKKKYQEWESNLPSDIRTIKLIASDAGHGPTHNFWDIMGFDYVYDDDDGPIEMIKHLKEEGVAEGKFTINARTGAKLDPRTGAELPPKEKPMTMKQMFAQPKQPKLTLDDVWLKIQSVVSNIYPDGDPIDHLAPWLKKHGIRDFKIGEILDRAAKKNGYKDLYDYWESMGDLPLSEQGVAEAAVPGSVTFAGKDPNEFKSPKGGKPVMVIQTEQGSRYLITSDGMVLRHKSVHANTGGEDAGLKDWSDKIEFYDRSKPLIAGGMQPLSFPDAVAHLADQGRIALSTGKSGARVAVILDNGNWRPATIADAMPKAAAAKPEWAKIVIKADAGTWGSQPKLGWQPLDYNQRGDGTLNRVHNGSPVSHGAKVAQGVAEAWSEKYKKSINCKNPKGFSQRAHCQGRKKNNEQVELDERKRKRKKKTARYYYGPAYYFGATDTGAEGGNGGGLEEDWKKSLANVGLAGAIGLGAAGGLELKDKIKSAFTKPTAQTTQPVQAKSQQVQVSPITNNPLETYLMNVAKKSGLTGIELAQFLGQCAHETMDYKRMIERGAKKYFNKYEPKFAPGKAKLLGNVKPGDGERYKGRGYIQLTGRYNYKTAGKALNLPLEQNPELAAQPEIAAQIALWYWSQRVRPEVENFADTTSVTRKINPGLSGLEDRHENFLSYMAQR